MSYRKIEIIVPGVPVPMARSRSTKNGHHYTPKRSAAYAQCVALAANAEMSRVKWAKDGAGPFRLTLDFNRLAFRGDFDNLAKGATDPLTKCGVWLDDRYVVDARIRLHVIDPKCYRPSTSIVVEDLS